MITVDDIKRARRLADLTQKQLADKIGVSCQTIGRLERKVTKPNKELIDKICSVLESLDNEEEKQKDSDNIYYKVLNKDMASPYTKFKYELGKTYTTDEELDSYKSGFHICKNIYEMIMWILDNKLEDCRFFKCTIGDKIIEDGYNVVSNSITLTEEIPFEMVDKDIRDNIDILINIENDWVRTVLARQGYVLDILVNDKSWSVRLAVAKHGYGLDILVKDENRMVRQEVARQGYGLDILVNDQNEYVAVLARKAVRKQNKEKRIQDSKQGTKDLL